MKKTGILLAVALVFALSSAMAFAEDESKPIGIDVWTKLSTSDALAFDLTAKIGATYTAPFGLAVGIDSLAFPLYPAVGFGPIGLYEEYDIVFGETGLDLLIGNSNSFGVVGGFSADGYVYTALGYALKGTSCASLELDTTYLAANAFSLGLSASPQAGWTFGFDKAGSLKLWASGWFGIVSGGAAALGFTSADLAVSYTYPIGPVKAKLTLDPTIDSAAAFTLPISLKATYSF